MTYPCHKPGMKKGIATATYILDPMREKAEEIRKSISSHNLGRVFNSIVGGYGWQDFMTGQVCADLSYVYDFEDVNTWAPMGPGSSRGLARLAWVKLSQKWFHEDFTRRLVDIRDQIAEKLQITDLTLHDTQNIMCEMDKYWRTLYEEGKPRSTYKPETAY